MFSCHSCGKTFQHLSALAISIHQEECDLAQNNSFVSPVAKCSSSAQNSNNSFVSPVAMCSSSSAHHVILDDDDDNNEHIFENEELLLLSEPDTEEDLALFRSQQIKSQTLALCVQNQNEQVDDEEEEDENFSISQRQNIIAPSNAPVVCSLPVPAPVILPQSAAPAPRMPDFSSMATAELSESMQKYGLRTGSRSAMITKLTAIWTAINNPANVQQQQQQQQPASIVSSRAPSASSASSAALFCPIERSQKRRKAKTPSELVKEKESHHPEFHEAQLVQLLKADVETYEKILMFEEVDPYHLKEKISLFGFEISTRDLIKFLQSQSVQCVSKKAHNASEKRRPLASINERQNW